MKRMETVFPTLPRVRITNSSGAVIHKRSQSFKLPPVARRPKRE